MTNMQVPRQADLSALVEAKCAPPLLRCEPRVLGGRYQMRRIIGRGIAADVYLGEDLLLERAVTLKIPHPSTIDTPARLEAFRREAISLAGVRSPNIVFIYDIGVTNEGAYLVMQHIEGHSLQEEIRRFGPMSQAPAMAALTQLLAGLAALHGRGLVHGDVRSSNVVLTSNGKAVLTDLGIVLDPRRTQAAVVGEEEGLTLARRARSARTQACDVYDVGLLMLFMLTGVDASRQSHRLGFEDLYRQLPAPLAGVARRSLQTDPAERFASAALMKTAIETALVSAPNVEVVPREASRLGRGLPEPATEAVDSRPTTKMAAVQLLPLVADARSEHLSAGPAVREQRPTTTITADDLLSLLADTVLPHRS